MMNVPSEKNGINKGQVFRGLAYSRPPVGEGWVGKQNERRAEDQGAQHSLNGV
jgi:hypothetical protein